jgi:hypothetical protein
LKRENRRGYAGHQPRHVVADAPNGYFSGSLGKRVSKPTLSPMHNAYGSAPLRHPAGAAGLCFIGAAGAPGLAERNGIKAPPATYSSP